MKNGGGYAFPSERPFPEGGAGATKWHTGMTMRQWYKGQALKGLLAARAIGGGDDPREGGVIFAEASAVLAEAMIAEDKKAELFVGAFPPAIKEVSGVMFFDLNI